MQKLVFGLLAISVLIGVAMPARPPSEAETNQSVLIDSGSPSTTPSETPSSTPVSSSETMLARAPNGHFYTQATVNGQPLPFVVDTGASSVALTVDDARRIGIYVDPTSFQTVGQGASGETRGMFVTLDRVEVAGRTVEHVNAVVLEGLSVNLLGQSVLTKLGGVEMNGDKMVLR